MLSRAVHTPVGDRLIFLHEWQYAFVEDEYGYEDDDARANKRDEGEDTLDQGILLPGPVSAFGGLLAYGSGKLAIDLDVIACHPCLLSKIRGF